MPPKRTAMTTTSDAKTCSKCGEAKPLAEFYAVGRRCRMCKRQADQAWSASYYSANREQRIAYQHRYRAENHEKVRSRETAYYAKNRGEISARRAAQYAAREATTDQMRPKTNAEIWWEENHGEVDNHRTR